MKGRPRVVLPLAAALAAVLAAALAVAFVMEAGERGQVELLRSGALERPKGATASAQQADRAFATGWGGWLRRVTLQIKAAMHLSRGLPASKVARLDGILAGDVKEDMKRGEAVASRLSAAAPVPRAASARRKAAVNAASRSRAQAQLDASEERQAEELDGLKPKATAAEIKSRLRVQKVGKATIDPFGKKLGNKVARDDDTVHADEQRLMAAEKQLEVETAAKVGPAPMARAQDAAHRRGRRAAKRVYFPRAVRHEQAKSLLGKAQKDLAVSAKDHAKLRQMQEHIKLVMSETPGDKAEAQKEEQQEEEQFDQTLSSLGLASKPAFKSKEQWPSQLQLPK